MPWPVRQNFSEQQVNLSHIITQHTKALTTVNNGDRYCQSLPWPDY